MSCIVDRGVLIDAELAELDRLREEFPAALDALADLRDRLDSAIVREESAVAARARMANAAQLQVVRMERARDVLHRLGELDEAARLQEGIVELVREARG